MNEGYDLYLGVGSDQVLPKAMREISLSFPLGFKAQEQNKKPYDLCE